MFRRQIFYGITLVLLVVIVFLLMRGRSAEKERRAQNIKLEEIASEPPSPVRAILPGNLEIVEATVSWTRNPDEKNASVAHHDMTIRNSGGGSYSGLRLRLEYIDSQGRPVEVRTFEVGETLPSGETKHVSDIIIEGIPDAASDFRAKILSADINNPN